MRQWASSCRTWSLLSRPARPHPGMDPVRVGAEHGPRSVPRLAHLHLRHVSAGSRDRGERPANASCGLRRKRDGTTQPGLPYPGELLRTWNPEPPSPPAWAPRLDQPTGLSSARLFLREEAVKAGVTSERAMDLTMAANEILTNALRYGRGVVALWGWPEDGRFLCQIQDDGPGIADPLAGYLPPADAWRPAADCGSHGSSWTCSRSCRTPRERRSGSTSTASGSPSGVAAAERADRPFARVPSHLDPLPAPATGPQIRVVRGGREGPQPHPGMNVPLRRSSFTSSSAWVAMSKRPSFLPRVLALPLGALR